MVTVRRFQELIAWQKARAPTADVYGVTQTGRFAKDFGLSNQLQRASVSTMANIAEGFDRCRPAEFCHFLDIAKGSCAEVISHLYVALDVGYLDSERFEPLLSHAEEVCRIIANLRSATQPKAPP